MTVENNIVQHLAAKWAPEVILLGGSRASGDETLRSDWDLYLIGSYSSRTCYPEEVLGEHLDVEVRPRSDVQDFILRLYNGPVRALRVLLDSPDVFGQRVVEQTRLAYEGGPTTKTVEAVAIDRSEMARLAEKIVCHSSDAEACFTNLGLFHRLAIQFWFESRKRWSLPPHQALPIIRAEDRNFANLLAVIASADSLESKLQACADIQHAMWGK